MGFKSVGEIIDEAGGTNGWLREQELIGDANEHRIRLTDMLARVEGAKFTLEHYETAKLHLGKIMESVRELARMIRKAEESAIESATDSPDGPEVGKNGHSTER